MTAWDSTSKYILSVVAGTLFSDSVFSCVSRSRTNQPEFVLTVCGYLSWCMSFYVNVCTHMYHGTCLEFQRTTFKSWFSPSTMWIDRRLSGKGKCLYPFEPSHCFLFILPCIFRWGLTSPGRPGTQNYLPAGIKGIGHHSQPSYCCLSMFSQLFWLVILLI